MSNDANTAERGSVFISYSRKDEGFVRNLYESLAAGGVHSWVDWEGIPPSADWMAEIASAIMGADAFLFVISPDSIASKVCTEEVELACKNNKKLVPILYRDVNPAEAHPQIAAVNWIMLRSQDPYENNFKKVIEAISTDLEWVKQHTRLIQRSGEWEKKSRNSSLLLQGTEIDESENWLTQSTSQKGREVLPLQAEYIRESRKVAIRRQRNLTIGVLIALVVSIVLGIFALIQRNVAVSAEKLARDNEAAAIANEQARATQQAIAESNEMARATQQAIAEVNEALAKQNENDAKAKRSAALSQTYQNRPGGMQVSTLLAIDSWLRLPSYEAENLLRQNISALPLPRASLQQGDWVWNIQWSPDGSLFVTSSSDGTACVWELDSGEKVYCVEHSGEVYDAHFTRDGQYLISAGADGKVAFWNAADGSFVRSYEYGAIIWDLDLSSNGRWLAAGRDDEFVTIIDLSDKQRPITLSQNGSVYVVNFSPDSIWLGIGTLKGNVRIWQVNASFSALGPVHTDEVYSLAFSNDSKWFASGGADSAARVMRTAAGRERYGINHGDWVEDLAFSPEGDWLVTVSDDNKVRVIETESGNEKMRMEHNGFAQRVAVSPNGEWIASTGKDHSVRIWDAHSGGQMYRIPLEGDGYALKFDPSGNYIVVGDRDGHISVWEISQLAARVGYIEFTEFIHQAQFSPSGEWLITNTDSRMTWRLPSDSLLTLHEGEQAEGIIPSQELTYAMDISADSRWIVVAESTQKRALLYDSQNGTTAVLEHGATLSGVAFNRDSSLLATCGADKLIKIWDVAQGEVKLTLPIEGSPETIAFSPAGPLLAVGMLNTTELWNSDEQSLVAAIGQQPGLIAALAFSRDGRYLATGSLDGTIMVWDTQDASFSQPVHRLQANGGVLTLTFSPDGKTLAVGDNSTYAYLFDLERGEEVARLPHIDDVTSVSFSPDGSLLATTSRKVIQIWRTDLIYLVPRSGLATVACTRLMTSIGEQEWPTYFGTDAYYLICPNLADGRN